HAALKAAGLARGGKDGVRLLGKGSLSAKLAFRVAGVSAGAREAIEAAGGSVEVIEVILAADKAKAKKGTVRKARLDKIASDKADKKGASDKGASGTTGA
ncbi:MAG: ribosomal protein, partial [Alphaproteobacteria bacterium]|nr:ribosomal protein [Alphaproteobacteria bacterium]